MNLIDRKKSRYGNLTFRFYLVSVKVKWGRESFPDVNVNTDEDPNVFKAQLFTLTGVQINRQKVMCKGVALKDDEWNFPLKDVCILNKFLLHSWFSPKIPNL